MNILNLTDEERDYLELLLHNHEYEENDRKLIDSLEFKFYQLKSDSYKNKLTGGLKWEFYILPMMNLMSSMIF